MILKWGVCRYTNGCHAHTHTPGRQVGIYKAQSGRAFAVKVVPKRFPVFPFSGLLKGCKGHKTHCFENGGTNQIRKTKQREVVLLQLLPQTLYSPRFSLFLRRQGWRLGHDDPKRRKWLFGWLLSRLCETLSRTPFCMCTSWRAQRHLAAVPLYRTRERRAFRSHRVCCGYPGSQGI